MAELGQDWIEQYTQEHGRAPSYDDYMEASRAVPVKQDYPNLSWEQIYYANHPGQAPRDYWGPQRTSAGSGGSAPPETAAYQPVKSWSDWLNVYGSQPGKVDDMNDALKVMQQGQGASALWDKFIDVAMPNRTDTQRQRLGQRYNSEFSKFMQESQLRAQQDAEPIGWHNWLTDKGPEGLAKDFAYMTPEDRGERPWAYNERQRVQWR